MFDNNTFEKSDEGVSPVIGVILMVAITVVLAAVIGTFVLNLTDNLEQSAQAAVSFDENAGQTVDIQLNNVQNADALYVSVSEINDETAQQYDSNGDGTDDALTVQGGVANDSGNGQHYLLNGNSGGVGTTVTVYTTDADLTGGTISVIGVLKGKENVVQTYDYQG